MTLQVGVEDIDTPRSAVLTTRQGAVQPLGSRMQALWTKDHVVCFTVCLMQAPALDPGGDK